MMQEMATASRPILTRGYCVCCRKMANFKTDPMAQGREEGATPNWREGLICQGCAMNSRMRAAVHLMEVVIGPNRGTRLYLTEQVTTLYRWVKARYPLAVGSEFLRDGTKSGESNLRGIRHEDLTALSFPDHRFDVVFTLEVMEHIPDFRRAFSECARILAPGGKMLLSVPFHRGPHHLLRARVKEDGTIDHLHPPEYHGDPLDRKGCLCFHHFGWDLLDYLRQDGFQRAAAYSIWSEGLGYLAGEGDMVMFIAEK
jgi:SAM-dependent methyltransferase